MTQPPSRQDLALLAENFEHSYPHEIAAWAAHTYVDGLVMATGFGPEGIVLLHVLSQVAPQVPAFYLDTDLFFPETYKLRDELERRFETTFMRVSTGLDLDAQTREYGDDLWSRDPDSCCRLRKVLPLRGYLKDKQAWITGIRRGQTAARQAARPIEWDAGNGLVKINPLINWSEEQVWTYIHLFDLPYNELHARGYPSIGCRPCTRPAAEGADPRSGRWVGFKKIECGIHLQEAGE